MLRILLVSLSLIATPAFAKKKRSHKAHSHGATQLDMVVTSKSAAMDFRGPSESLFGFEHTPESDKDKKTVADQIAKLGNKSNDLVKFPADRGCKTTVKEVETFVSEGHKHGHDGDRDHKKDHDHDDDHDHKKGHDKDHDHDDDHDHKKGHDENHDHDDDHHAGEHSEFHIKLTVACEKKIAGSELSFGFSEVFPRVKSVKVQILTESGQFGKTVKGKSDKIKI